MTFDQLKNLKDGDRVWWVAEGASEKSYGTVRYGVLGGPAYVEWDDRVPGFDVPPRTYFLEENADSLIHLRRDYRVDVESGANVRRYADLAAEITRAVTEYDSNRQSSLRPARMTAELREKSVKVRSVTDSKG